MMEKQIAYIRNKMIGLIAIIAIVSAWQWDFIHEGVMAHVWTTGSILSAFAFAIIMAFIFVHKLKNEVIAFNALKEMWDDIRMGQVEQKADPLWRHYRCSRPGRIFKRPRLLGHAYDLVTDELARTKKIRDFGRDHEHAGPQDRRDHRRREVRCSATCPGFWSSWA